MSRNLLAGIGFSNHKNLKIVQLDAIANVFVFAYSSTNRLGYLFLRLNVVGNFVFIS